MNLCPIMLKLTGKCAVVVGGGAVGLRKVRMLKGTGARVTLIAEAVPDDPCLDGAEVIRGRYDPRFLDEAALVFACTNDQALNAQIARDARKAGAIVNCVDQPEDCDFYVPAFVVDGDVIVAIGTGGAAPALAGRLKKALARALPERIGQFAHVLARMRETVKDRIPDLRRRGEILKTLAGQDSYEAFLAGGAEALGAIREKLIRMEVLQNESPDGDGKRERED